MENMDRLVDPKIRHRRTLRRIIVSLAAGSVLVAVLTLLAGWIRPSVRLDRIRTTLVEQGEVTATLDASGLVVPEFEYVLTAAAATRIVDVLLPVGSPVKAGETILQLDDAEAKREVNRFQEQISLQGNAREMANLELERALNDLKMQRQIKELELESFQYEADRNRQYYDMGMVTDDLVRKANVDVKRATIELEHIAASLATTSDDIAAKLDGLALEISILGKDLDRARERLARMSVTSDRDGIVTWVANSIGTNVAEGEALVRVADLSVFRVEATLSDVLARRLTVGLPATIRTGDTRLSGFVAKILPAVNNGIVTFEVQLDEKNHHVLRPNLRVDVHAVTEQHPSALRLKRGPLLNVDGQTTMFVIRDDMAIQTPVTLGLSNFEHYEITEGLVAGDKVIISDMSSYRDVKEVKLR